MKIILTAAAFLCAVSINAQAQAENVARPERTKQPQAAQAEIAPAGKTNSEATAPVPASIATPEHLKKMEADSRAPKAVEQKQPENKATAPKTESK